jgi:hypothetical protein
MASWLDSLIDNTTKLANAGQGVISALKGDESAEENAYLKGYAAGIEQQKEDEKDEIKIGSFSISTSGILWIVGGTIGLLAAALAFKKLIK